MKNWLPIIALSVVAASCGDKEDPSNGSDGTVNYVMSLRGQDASDQSADYFLTVDDLMSGEISAHGNGEELVGWNYTGKYGDTYFALGYDLNECVGYKVSNGKLAGQGKFVFERMDMINPIDDESFLAIGAPWGGGSFDCQLQIVNIDDIAIHKNVKHPIYEPYDSSGAQLNAWPTGSFVDNDKLFVSFYPLNGATWETQNTDTAFISVYSYPGLEYLKTIKNTQAAPIGYYGSQPCIVEDEVGNHYTLSGGSKVTGYTQVTKPSAILKINAGESDFDKNYFFDVEATGYKVLSGVYAGDGKVVAKVISKSLDESASQVSQWAAFDETTAILSIAIIDLNTQSLTIVNDVPLHGGQYKTPFLVENNKVYTSVNDGTEAHVYQVDPLNATAKKGAKLIGNQFQGLYSGK